MRWTNLRKEVYEIIKKNHKPLCVNEISSNISNYDLSNIYRSIKVLSEEGLINSLTVSGSNFYFIGEGHFLCCKKCKVLFNFDKCVGHNIVDSLEKEFDFVINNHVLLFEGYCKNCR